MRIWSIHPKYLDAKGLVALWRETLLAKHVLEGRTKGYRNHPQLNRFKNAIRPLDAVNLYLMEVFNESINRGYHFDDAKFYISGKPLKMAVTQGQLNYEFNHLLSKLKIRDPELYKELKRNEIIEAHPLFKIVKGDIEDWEIIRG